MSNLGYNGPQSLYLIRLGVYLKKYQPSTFPSILKVCCDIEYLAHVVHSLEVTSNIKCWSRGHTHLIGVSPVGRGGSGSTPCSKKDIMDRVSLLSGDVNRQLKRKFPKLISCRFEMRLPMTPTSYVTVLETKTHSCNPMKNYCQISKNISALQLQ